MLKTPELLAPAGNMESLIAAVENGADAVYLGVKDFSARAYAGNFTIEEFREALDFAHLRGVKVYVTMNTLIKDSEMEKALELMYTLDELGTDAIIVQDIGLLELAREKVPSLPIHASTQMTIHNTEAVLALKEMGVKRIVLARELSLEEISRIKNETGVEIEAFVHGALCICYSGQCLMSSMIGGRSGNRGYCAQPCRKQYRLRRDGKEIKTEGSYLLSPKDLNTSEILPELIKSGIDSFKIEGRMKRPEYVAGVVRIYRSLIDRFVEDPDNYSVTDEEKENLEQLFNREFTTGYFEGDPAGDLMSRERPHNQGIVVGKVSGFNNKFKRMEITLTGELEVGDGIGFEGSRDAGTIVRGIYIGDRLEKKAGNGEVITINFDQPPKNGTTVYRTLDDSLMRELQASYNSPAPIRKVPVSIKFKALIGEKLELLLSDNENNTSTVISDYIVERSQKRPTTEDDVKKQLAKTGNTVFEAQDIKVDMPDDAFIPIKELNNARTEATTELERIRIEKFRRPAHDRSSEISDEETDVGAESEEKKILLSVSVNNSENFNSALKSGADLVYIDVSLKELQTLEWKVMTELAIEKNIPVYLHTSIITKDPELQNVKETIKLAKELGFEGIITANLGVLEIARNYGLKILTDSSMNVFNKHSLHALEEKDADAVTLSTEMNLGQITDIARYGDCEYIAHGQIQIMESEHCLIGGVLGQKEENGFNCGSQCKSGSFEIIDEKGFEFPIKTDSECRTHIFNSRELCLLDDIPQLIKAGVSRLRIDARNMDDYNVGMVTRAYRANIDAYYTGDTKHVWQGSDISEFHTRGHYHRGVQ
jgi:Collagenase and related proteases